MRIIRTAGFAKAFKKLPTNQRRDVDAVVSRICENPALGELKFGNLAGVRVYKFRMANHFTLLAYTYNDHTITLTLLKLGPHENFYRDLEKSL